MTVCCPSDSLPAAPLPPSQSETYRKINSTCSMCCCDNRLSMHVPIGKTIKIPSQRNRSDLDCLSWLPSSYSNDVECYITGVPLQEATQIILVFADVYGMQYGNHKAFCDQLADHLPQTTILLPDLFRGSPILTPCLYKWAILPTIVMNLFFRVNHIIADLLDTVWPWIGRQSDAPISAVGFCLGAWLVGKSLGGWFPNLQCGVGIHPSFRPERLFGRSEHELAKTIGSKPYLLLPAGNDTLQPSHLGVQAMAQARQVSSEEVAIPFPDMLHGWVTRGDSTVSSIHENQQRALHVTVVFLQQYIVQRIDSNMEQ